MAKKKDVVDTPPKDTKRGKKTVVASDESIIDDIMSIIEAKYGKGVVSAGDKIFKSQRVSFGSFSIDYITGGGIPRGRIIEIIGEESVGKTLIALLAANEFIKLKKQVYWVDAENSWDESFVAWGIKHGVDMGAISVVRPTSGEQAWGVLRTVAEKNADALVVIDSWAALTSSEEIECNTGDTNVAPNARMNNQGIRQLQTALNNPTNLCNVLVINQQRDAIGPMRRKVTPGGRGIKFAAAIRLEVRRKMWIDQTKSGIKETIGQETSVKAIKNKTYPPMKEAITIFYVADNKFNCLGFDNIRDMIRYGILWKRVKELKADKKSGTEAGYYYIDDDGEFIWIGKDENRAVFQLNKPENSEILNDFKTIMYKELSRRIEIERTGHDPSSISEDDIRDLKELEDEEKAISEETERGES